MIDLAAVNTAIRAIIRDMLDMPAGSVRPANQDAPVGDSQFATVLLMSARSLGWAQPKNTNEAAPSTNVNELIESQVEVLASVQFFKGDAFTKAKRLELVLQSSPAREQILNAGLGLVRFSQARDLSAIDATVFEPRGQIDITFSVIASEQFSIPTYTTFPIAVSNGNVILDNEVSAP